MSGWETFSHIWEFLSIPFMIVDDSKLNILFNFCVNDLKTRHCILPFEIEVIELNSAEIPCDDFK